MSGMTEVFSVVLHSNQSRDSSSLNGGVIEGAVLGNDMCDYTCFFKQGGSSDDFILPDGSLYLSGPSRCIVGEEWILRVKFNLKKNDKELELCHGYLSMSPYDCKNYFDQHLTSVVQGRDGYALVNFVMYKYGVQATVEVSLVANLVLVVHVYGHIHALNDAPKFRNSHERKHFRSTMFNASENKPHHLEGNTIPLSRCVTVVPLGGHLIIEAGLFDVMKFPLAVGLASFEAQTSGTETQTIGNIQVKVTWTKHVMGKCKCPLGG